MLTSTGLSFAETHAHQLNAHDLSRGRRTERERRWLASERARMLASDAFVKSEAGNITAVNRSEAASFFRIDEYVVGTARERKVGRLVNAFGNDPELGPAVTEFAKLVREECDHE